MAQLIVAHPFSSAVADGGNSALVQPSNWNANHTVAGFLTAGLASDATVNGTTSMVKITGLDLTVGLGSWHFKYLIRYQTSITTTGVKFAVNHSGTVTSFMANHYFSQALSTAVTAIADQDNAGAAVGIDSSMPTRAINITAGPTASADTVNADMMWIVEGLMVITGSGDLQLFHGSETAANTTVMTGSGVQVVKVA